MVFRRTGSTSSSASDSHGDKSVNTPGTSIQREPTSASRETISRKCDVEGCGKIYTGGDSANSLARHKREKHSNRLSSICPVQFCGHSSNRLHNLRHHWNTKHKGMAMPEWLVATQTRGGGGVKRKRVPLTPHMF